MMEQLLLACIVVIGGDIISHSALWYHMGRVEKAVFNGGVKKCALSQEQTSAILSAIKKK